MFCGKCGAKLEDESLFCMRCGAPQAKQDDDAHILQTDNLRRQGSTPSSPMDAFMEGVHKGGVHHILLVASIIVAISGFLPMLDILGMADMSLEDMSEPFALLLVVIGIGAAYMSMIGNYAISVSIGNGLLLMLLIFLYQWRQKLREMEQWGRVIAKNAITADIGFYAICFAILALIAGGLVASLQRDGKQPDANLLLSRWKEITFQNVGVGTMNIPGIAVAIAILVLLLCAASSGDTNFGM